MVRLAFAPRPEGSYLGSIERVCGGLREHQIGALFGQIGKQWQR